MRDVYKDTMDAIKAPDALVEKTLKAMRKEHGKLAAQTEAAAIHQETKDQAADRKSSTPVYQKRPPRAAAYEKRREGQDSPKKSRWMMYAGLPAAACLCLLVAVIAPRLLNHEADVYNAPVATFYSPGEETEMPAKNTADTDEPKEGAMPVTAETEPPAVQNTPVAEENEEEATESIIEAVATENLATRSGPSTEYRETGTYQVKGERVHLISLAYDEGGTGWMQCEVAYGSKLRRVYTGLKRLDDTTFSLDSIPVEESLNEQAQVIETVKAMYGPGEGYDTYAELTLDEGQTVTMIAIENAYAQVEWTTATQSYRAWVPMNSLNSL